MLGFSFTNLLLKVGNYSVTAAVDAGPQQRVAFFYQSKDVTVQLIVIIIVLSSGRLAGILNCSGAGLFLQSSYTQCQSNLNTIIHGSHTLCA